MDLLPLEQGNSPHFYISGNVIVHPSAVIAPSVLLQADPGSQLIIAAGVCVGVGCVLHAHQGTLEIEPGAILGSGVLVVGKGKIGTRACIGSMTTIIDSSIDPKQSIPPGSLIGDTSRKVSLEKSAEAPKVEDAEAFASHPVSAGVDSSDSKASTPASSTPASAPKSPTQVYGQAYLERILITMFPHRQSLNRPSDPSSSDQPPTAEES
jgi:carbon dioxide concentrating mechanism protein CcmN